MTGRMKKRRHLHLRIREIEAAMKRVQDDEKEKIAGKTPDGSEEDGSDLSEASLAEDGTAEDRRKRCWL